VFQKEYNLQIPYTRAHTMSAAISALFDTYRYGLPRYAIGPICDNVEGQLIAFSIGLGLCYGRALYSLLCSYSSSLSKCTLVACAVLGVILGVLAIASIAPFCALLPRRQSYIFNGMVLDLFWELFSRCLCTTFCAVTFGILYMIGTHAPTGTDGFPS